MGARRGGATVGAPPPPVKKQNQIIQFHFRGRGLFSTFSLCEAFFATFFLLMGGGPFPSFEGPSAIFFSMWGPFCYVFLFIGGIFHVWKSLLLFSLCGSPFCLYGGAFYELAPPPPHIRISGGVHTC